MTENADISKVGDFCAFYKNEASTRASFQHYHDSYEIVFFVNVDLEIFIKDIHYEVHDGDILFINAFDIHRFIYPNTTTVYTRYVLNFKKDYIFPQLKAAGIESILDDLGSSRYARAETTLKERTELESLLKSIIHADHSYSEPLLREAALKSYLLLLLIHIRELMKRVQSKDDLNKKEVLVQDIVQFIDTHYMLEVSLDLLEETFFTDKFHISHIFKEVTGFSIMEYVQQRRINEAQKMLKNSANKITDICFDCGFHNIQHFHRVFKKISGITPHKYRKL